MTVPVQIPLNVSIANGATTVFPYGFKLLSAGDLVVTVNGEARTLDVDYTIDGVGDNDGGNVTFITGAPAAGAIVARVRAMPFSRAVDFQTGGDLLARTVNDDQDSPVMMIQQLAATALQLVVDPTGEAAFVWDAKGYRLIRLGDGIDTTDAINLGQAYTIVEDVLNGGGVGVTPRYWQFEGDGETTTFDLPGADVYDALFYDTALEGEVLEPGVDFTIIQGTTTDDTGIEFTVAPALGAKGFTVLRGYARPKAVDDPITTLRIPVKTVTALDTLLDSEFEFALIRATAATFADMTIRANTGAANDMGTGSYFSVVQKGDGQVELLGEVGVTLDVPAGFRPATRAKHSVISATCESGAGNTWVISGDLAEV